MQNYILLLPLYNDWKSLQKLLTLINIKLKKFPKKIEIVVVDDNSTVSPQLNIKKLKNIKKVKLLKLNKNLGSQKAISIGLSYLDSINKKSIITILDSDGEDDFNKVLEMIKIAESNKDKIVVSSRSKRREGNIFIFFYLLHKIITFTFSFKWINFGNYSSFDSRNLTKILSNNNSWFAFSSCVAKNCDVIKVEAERKRRFFGKSKLSFIGLFIHALRVNVPFFPRIILSSVFYTIILIYLKESITFLLYPSLSAIILFNLTLILTFFYSMPGEYNRRMKFIKKVKF